MHSVYNNHDHDHDYDYQKANHNHNIEKKTGGDFVSEQKQSELLVIVIVSLAEVDPCRDGTGGPGTRVVGADTWRGTAW